MTSLTPVFISLLFMMIYGIIMLWVRHTRVVHKIQVVTTIITLAGALVFTVFVEYIWMIELFPFS